MKSEIAISFFAVVMISTLAIMLNIKENQVNFLSDEIKIVESQRDSALTLYLKEKKNVNIPYDWKIKQSYKCPHCESNYKFDLFEFIINDEDVTAVIKCYKCNKLFTVTKKLVVNKF